MPKYAKDERGVSMMGKASEIWKEIKPKIGEMLAAVNDIETRAEKAQEEAYQKGLSDAWEAARNVVALSTVDRREVFGSEYMYSILEKHTASEAIEKIRQYEQEKEEQIQVGDEVKGKYGTTAGMLGIVTRLDDALQNYNVVWSDGSTICFTGYRERGDVVKTGRHFPEIAEVLQKMRGNAT